MTFDSRSSARLDYAPCLYGPSKTRFRGPKRTLDAPYIAFFGGTTTFGKFVQTPFPSLIEEALEITCVNFGCVNGSIDVYATDPALRDIALGAQATVIQVTSPRNMSNRFYRVHPRRNDRFVDASHLLRTIYREVDFAEFSFTNHMLTRLARVSPTRFESVLEELRAAWLARMRMVLGQLKGPVVLLWASREAADNTADKIDADPAFVTRSMLNQTAPLATDLVEVVVSESAQRLGTEGMVFAEMDASAAATMLGPLAHREIADALVPVLRDLLK